MARGTTLRNFRADDELWRSALELAEKRGETISEVLREALREYLARHAGE